LSENLDQVQQEAHNMGETSILIKAHAQRLFGKPKIEHWSGRKVTLVKYLNVNIVFLKHINNLTTFLMSQTVSFLFVITSAH